MTRSYTVAGSCANSYFMKDDASVISRKCWVEPIAQPNRQEWRSHYIQKCY
ncbi:hypothetical protein [Microcoleus sp. FACHB-SPT15]|uniref:hypothetical protein n=1 Tax=Microcoleus sp. FACHB-SPT15 TaxID=2692830 RepID=UPI001A7E597E|nr:hypothetical protein [Microcoleus sp. FACHB-SPT15]